MQTIWYKNFGGPEDDIGYDIVELPSGKIAVLATANDWSWSVPFERGLGGDLSDTLGNMDTWVLMLDNSGNLLWEDVYGTTDADGAFSMIYTQDHHLLIGGNTYGNDTHLLGHHGPVFTHLDWSLMKIDTLGNVIWGKQIGGTVNEQDMSPLTETANGDIMFAGSTTSIDYDCIDSDGILPQNDTSGYNKIFVGCFDKNGNRKWNIRVGTYRETGIAAWRRAAHFNSNTQMLTVIGAALYGYLPWPQYSFSGLIDNRFDIVLMQVDTSGNVSWKNSFGGADKDGGYFICEDPYKNGLVCGGTLQSNDGIYGREIDSIIGTNAGPRATLCFTDELGEIKHTYRMNESDTAKTAMGTRVEDLIVYRDKLLCAYTGQNPDSTCTKKGDPFPGGTYNISFIIPKNVIEPPDTNKTDTIPNFGNAVFLVYPNPTNDILTIRQKESEPFELILYNTSGQVVRRKRFTEKENRLFVKDLAVGLYFLNLKTANNKFNFKILKK